MQSFCLEKVEHKEATKEGVESVPEERPQHQIQQYAPVHQHLSYTFERVKSNWQFQLIKEILNREIKEEILQMI